jgi:signal transduction histidine kinase
VNRRDSARPLPRSAALTDLERLVRQLGQPDQGLLDAASETMHGTSAAVDLSVVPKFLEEAAEICVGAHSRWRETTPEQRALLRGCSLDLIGLAADQCLRLDRSFAEYRQSEADVKGAGEQLAAALERAEVLAEQARSVIQTVSGVPQQGVSAEVEDPAAAFTSALSNLRDTACELLERGSPGVRKRCSLYALDQAYVQTLEVTLGELADLARRASDAAAVARKKVQLERTLACARPLVDQVAQAFAHASRLDRKITPLRHGPDPVQAKRPADQKGRGTVVMQQKTALIKPAAPAPAKHVEKLVIGGGSAGDRYKR